jgi:hypothetical protein
MLCALELVGELLNMAGEARGVDIRVGFEIGGTFTDVLVSVSTGEIFAFKVLSTPEQIAQHVVRCVQQVETAYGVILTNDLQVDEAATRCRREKADSA